MDWNKHADWQGLPGVLPSRPDPYVVWANLTDWRDLASDDAHPAPLIVEAKAGQGAALRAALRAIPGVAVPEVYDGAPASDIFTVRLPRATLAALGDAAIAPLIERFDLCLPVSPERPRAPAPPEQEQEEAFKPVKSLDAKVLVGVVDNGCPFAHAKLRYRDGARWRSRIGWIWDLRDEPAFVRLQAGGPWWRTPPELGYGAEVPPGKVDDAIALATRSGQVADATCYEIVGDLDLRRHASHGAHVLDVLVGKVPVRERMPGEAEPHRPPQWTPEPDGPGDPKSVAVAFVQLPKSALQDSSGGWLGAHMLDAVRYLVARAGKAEHVVVNLSYGCTTGPHDGSSILERAFDALIAPPAEPSPKLHLVVAAGNSFAARCHAVIAPRHLRKQAGAAWRASLPAWRVRPGGETPSFLQVWFPSAPPGKATRFALRIAAPGAAVFRLGVDEAATLERDGQVVATAVNLSASSRGDGAMALVVVAPTLVHGSARRPAPHGDWTIGIEAEGDRPGKLVHAYIARNDRDHGMLRRGQPSAFVDAADAPRRYLRDPADDTGKRKAADAHDGRQAGRSKLRRRGTLNGIATGQHVIVAAGHVHPRRGHAPYSSAGMSELAVADPRGRGPSHSRPADESAVLHGLRAAGNAGGTTFRLVGTSTSAPQAARDAVRGLLTPAPQRPRPMPPPGIADPDDVFGPDGMLGPAGKPRPGT